MSQREPQLGIVSSKGVDLQALGVRVRRSITSELTKRQSSDPVAIMKRKVCARRVSDMK